MKKIMIVDDSALMRRVLCDIIQSDGNYVIQKECRNGQEALDALRAEKYDGVLLDVNMPVMDGLQLLQMLQREKIATNVIMVSTLTLKDADVTIRALELGAVDFVTKPENITDAKGGRFSRELLNKMNAIILKDAGNISGAVHAIIGDNRKKTFAGTSSAGPAKESGVPFTGKKLIALASSTGGPKALHQVIPNLPANMSCPMVIVQHMPSGFTKSMADRLNELSNVKVKEAEDNDPLMRGWVYVAPGGKHMKILLEKDGTHRIKLTDEDPIGGLKPCADIMYESLEKSAFDEITCVVLTGMGSDGTKGIVGLKNKKRIHTIAQNQDSCVVYGMPRAVYEAGVVDEVVDLKDVANTIIKNVGVI